MAQGEWNDAVAETIVCFSFSHFETLCKSNKLCYTEYVNKS